MSSIYQKIRDKFIDFIQSPRPVLSKKKTVLLVLQPSWGKKWRKEEKAEKQDLPNLSENILVFFLFLLLFLFFLSQYLYLHR